MPIHYGLENPKFGNEETASRYGGNCACTEYVVTGSDKGWSSSLSFNNSSPFPETKRKQSEDTHNPLRLNSIYIHYVKKCKHLNVS
jgi:hypothetical protein